MIKNQTFLFVADNTGVKKIMCINILGQYKKYATIGNMIIGVVKSVITKSTIKKSSIIKALIIRTKKTFKRNDGTIIRFDDNACILINSSNNLLGTRIFGPVPYEIKEKYLKIASLAINII